METHHDHYYVPEQSPWPFISAISLFVLATGAATFVQQHSATGIAPNHGTAGQYLLPLGVSAIICMMFMWFRDTIRESRNHLNSAQMDLSYRMGMMWFIFSEVMFFAAFFGALFYARNFSVPWMAGEGGKVMTHNLLWPNFQNLWPLTRMPDGRTTEAMHAWGLPFINTVLLVSSSVFISKAHHALLDNKRGILIVNLIITLVLGFSFLALQATEYMHAYTHMNLRLDAGIYGTTFFMLTGFHGLHVTIGALMLTVMLLRIFKGHFSPENHFAFQAASWYWHFVDVVWLFLFVCVYLL